MPALGVLFVPVFVQMGAMLLDEGWFHRRRGLPKWERVGHPLDTLTVAACYAWTLVRTPGERHAVPVYVALAAFSCLFITKDELVHKRACEGWETWLHAVLFVIHPIVFLALGIVWASGKNAWLLRTQLALTIAFAAYQLVYWSIPWNPLRKAKRLAALSDP
ncbi:MAG: hypothetical protein M3O50_01625 [Myxococcota bacterium]|nr:hypothetical protein [Myxococcota bacterium]